MSKPDPPAPPNPRDTASAATSTNVGTAVANRYLNNVNQITPEGELRYDPTGEYNWHDPYTNLDVTIPTFTATQIRTPQQQAIADQQNAAKYNLAGLANSQSARVSGLLGNEMDYSGAPQAGEPGWLKNVGNATGMLGDVGELQRNLGDFGTPQSTFGEAGDITRTYGPADDFSSDRSRVEESLYGRLNPQLERERSNIEQRLQDQGIRYGSEAYTRAMDDYSRQANDARLAVTAQGGQEQQRMMDMAAQRAGFQNAAQKLAYDQAQGRGEFANIAQQQRFMQGQAAGQFANQAQKDAFAQQVARGNFWNTAQAQNMSIAQNVFNAQNAARTQYLGEQYARRNQPINEISALMSGSQVKDPSFINAPQNQIPTTDTAGIINARFGQDMDIYKQESQSFNSLMGGIMGMVGGIGGGWARSDRRVKDDIDRVGTVFAAGPDGESPLPIYDYSFKDDPSNARHRGPMAQDVEKIDRRAVRERKGVKYIDTTRMGSILKAA